MKILRFSFCTLHSRQRRAGFTLIELLIVVAIIGILATLLMANFIGVQQRARDAQRKSDLRQIQSALELYRADNGNYPVGTSISVLSNCSGSFGDPSCSATYMKTIPTDPSGSSYSNGGNYGYGSPAPGTKYYLVACLENTNDKGYGTFKFSPYNGSTWSLSDALVAESSMALYGFISSTPVCMPPKGVLFMFENP